MRAVRHPNVAQEASTSASVQSKLAIYLHLRDASA